MRYVLCYFTCNEYLVSDIWDVSLYNDQFREIKDQIPEIAGPGPLVLYILFVLVNIRCTLNIRTLIEYVIVIFSKGWN